MTISGGFGFLRASSQRGGPRVLDFAGWVLFLASAAFVVFWLAPRKGVDFADEGWYLQAAFFAATGQGFDSLLPQAPFYLVNAALMRLGLWGYLDQRLAYYALAALSLSCLGAGLSRHDRSGFAVPLGAAAGLFCALTSIISYENGPVLFASLALGLAMLAGTAARTWLRLPLAILAGAALALAAFVNFTALPAAVCCAGAFFLASGATAASAAAASFCAFFGAGACWYLRAIGLAEFFRPPSETHGFFWAKLPGMLAFAGQWGAVFVPVFFLAWIIGRRRPGFAAFSLTLLRIMTLGTCLTFAALMLRRIGLAPGLFDAAAVFSPARLIGLSWIGELPDLLQFQLVLFLGFALTWLALAGTFEKTRGYALFAAVTACIWAFWLIQTFLSGSAVSLRSFFAGPLIAASLARIAAFERSRAPGANRRGRGIVFVSALAALGCCLMYAVSYTHPGATVPYGEKVALSAPKLAGIMEDPERAALLDELMAVYEEQGCRDKTVFVFRFANLLHYLFEKKAPLDLSYILPSRRYPGERMLEALRTSPGWCVFVTKNNMFDPGWEKTGPVIEMLETRSETVIRLGETPKRHLYDDFTAYVGPKAPAGHSNPARDLRFDARRR